MRKKKSKIRGMIFVLFIVFLLVFSFGALKKCQVENEPPEPPPDEEVQITFDTDEIVF